MLAAAVRIPTALLCAIAFGLAVMRGCANTGDVAPDANLLLFAAGLAGVGYAAITLIMALPLTFRQPEAGAASAWRGIAIRACGGRNRAGDGGVCFRLLSSFHGEAGPLAGNGAGRDDARIDHDAITAASPPPTHRSA